MKNMVILIHKSSYHYQNDKNWFKSIHQPIIYNFVFLFLEGATYCELGWSEHNRECYYVNNNLLSHEDARTACEALGAELATIHSSGANSHIQGLISSVSSSTARIGM